MASSAIDFRLPLDVKPTHYDLTILTDIDNFKFKGVAIIDLDVFKDTSLVTFNAANLIIHDITISSNGPSDRQIEPTNTIDEKAQRVTLQLPSSLTKGSTAQLKILYEGNLTDNMLGYYYSSFEQHGIKRYYTLTQFEPTSARRAFPCWDEPLLKATYNITLVSRTDTVNLSNMPPISEESYSDSVSMHMIENLFEKSIIDDSSTTVGWKVTQFEKTPPVSSYLIAYANGPFEYLQSSYTSPLSGMTRPLRIYATSDLIPQAQFALDIKARVLPVYERVFEIEFPLPKLDTLVVHDFEFGAMENWGLITGRTALYLLDPKRIDIKAKKDIASTQSHEVAHMWFGNITTMSWWDNVWLNEGFASLMGEVIILNKVFPEWKVYSSFHTGHVETALGLDAKRSSHPIHLDIPDVNEINQVIDMLSYSKAAAVLHMLSVYVGEDKFLNGVSIYLKKHLYGNSVAEDLWEGIQEATDLDIPELMTKWTREVGFPVVRVIETPGGLRFRQDRFFETGDIIETENETIWRIPLNILTTDVNGKTDVDHDALLKDREMDYKLDVDRTWKVNAGATGFYRVLYTAERLSKLGEEAARPGSVFSLEDRLGLVSDALVLASSGLATMDSALALIDTFRFEPEYLVWSGISQHLSKFIEVWWEQRTAVEDLNAFRRGLFAPIVRKLGYEYNDQESLDAAQLRTLAVTQAIAGGSKEVIEKLKTWFEVFVTSGSDVHIPPDLVRPTFVVGATYGDRLEWEALRNIYLEPSNPTAKVAAAFGMSSTRKPELIEATLQFIMGFAQNQDVMYFFIGLGENIAARRRVAAYFKDNFVHFYKRFEGNYTLKSLLEWSHSNLSTYQDADNLEAFFSGKDITKFSRILPQTLETIRGKAAWIERSKVEVGEWLARWKKMNQIEAGL